MTTSSAPVTDAQVFSFLEGLRRNFPDPRDNRGKRHSLEFTLVAVAVAMLSRCQTLSSVHRFICNKLDWLRELTGMPCAAALSRAYLPRFLDRLSWTALCRLIGQHFNSAVSLEHWVAVDGKALRGSSDEDTREAVVMAVAHDSGEDLARAPQSGAKTSEIPVVRQLLTDAGLLSHRISMDAMHCNEETLSLIAQAGGTYLVQVKGNQPVLEQLCGSLALHEPSLAFLTDVDKGHGRVTTRTHHLLPLRATTLDARWDASHLRYLVVTHRETYTPAKRGTSTELSYYVTNMTDTWTHASLLAELARAIRGHWTVESNNWVRDVTLGEDWVRVGASNQAQVLALLRSLTLNLLRKTGGQNLQAVLDRFCYVPSALADWLKATKVL
jgi:predicted transposase YbfD/YdcC